MVVHPERFSMVFEISMTFITTFVMMANKWKLKIDGERDLQQYNVPNNLT